MSKKGQLPDGFIIGCLEFLATSRNNEGQHSVASILLVAADRLRAHAGLPPRMTDAECERLLNFVLSDEMECVAND